MDRLESMRKGMQEINENLMDALQNLLERGEKIELLVQRTEELTTQTNMFRQAAREARNRAWWQEKSYIACAIIIVLLCLIMLIVFPVCGITFSRCRSGRSVLLEGTEQEHSNWNPMIIKQRLLDLLA